MKKQNNPKVIPIILDILQESSYMTGELFSAFMCGYGESYRRINKILYDRQSGKSTKESWGDKFIDEQRFYDAVNYLKRNGFIEKKKGKKDKKISFMQIPLAAAAIATAARLRKKWKKTVSLRK